MTGGLAAKGEPYRFQLFLLAYTPLVLGLDGRARAAWQEWALGFATFVVLAAWTWRADPDLRRQVWLCVGVATCFEITASLVLGLYSYRLHGIPLFVPPGHGLVYLFGLTAAGTPAGRSRVARFAVLGAAFIWALAGLTLLPGLTGRTDVTGALCLLPLAAFVLLSPRGAVFAAIFVIVAELELVGTASGDWTWAATVPHLGLGQGNPPSAIAGAYCVIDGTVLLITMALARAARKRLAAEV